MVDSPTVAGMVAGMVASGTVNRPTVAGPMVGNSTKTKEDPLNRSNQDCRDAEDGKEEEELRGVAEIGGDGPSRTGGALRKSVMIVDDNAMNRALVRRMLYMISNPKKPGKAAESTSTTPALQALEIEICEAENGVQALGFVAKQGSFDLIVMDKFMPVMNGDEATIKLREKGYTGSILGFSGETSPSAIAEFRSSGVNEMLRKGCSRAELEQVVRKHLVYE
jgi:CheY-like chemotaxis protein